MLGDFDQLIRDYGGLAVFLGAALEGEAAVTTGGFLAHRGMIDPYAAFAGAFAGSFAADQIIFFLARYHRESRFIVRVRQRPTFARAMRFIETRPRLFCTAFRFIYGMRTAGPIAIGVSQVPTRQFVLLNGMSAAVWAATFTFIGYRFGRVFELVIASILSDPRVATASVALFLGVLIFFIRRRTKARRSVRLP